MSAIHPTQHVVMLLGNFKRTKERKRNTALFPITSLAHTAECCCEEQMILCGLEKIEQLIGKNELQAQRLPEPDNPQQGMIMTGWQC